MSTPLRTFFVAAILLVMTFRPAVAHPGRGLVQLADGRIAFSDVFNSTVWVTDLDGDIEHMIPDPIHVHAFSIAPDGSLIAEEHDHRNGAPYVTLYRLKAGQRAEALFGPYRSKTEIPGHLVDQRGQYYGTLFYNRDLNGRGIYRWDAAGNETRLAGGGEPFTDGTGPDAGFRRISGIAWAPDSSIVVADANAIRIVSRDGDLRTLVHDHPLLNEGPNPYFESLGRPRLYGVHVTTDYTVYVANFSQSRLVRVSGPDLSPPTVELVHEAENGWAPVSCIELSDTSLLVLEAPSIEGDNAFGMRLLRLRPNSPPELVAHTPR